MDRLVDHLFVFDGDGIVKDFPGNYTQYRMTMKEKEIMSQDKWQMAEKKQASNSVNNQPTTTIQKRQPSFKEKREFEMLEKEIANLTKEKNSTTEKLNSSDTPFDELSRLSVRIGEIEKLLDEKEFRWLELSELVG
jgi:ATP-binding cassette subfamily F protein uup